MTEEVPGPALDEPLGDVGDQASRLQMVQEQEAIRAALAGQVHGTDALDDRGPDIEPLEGPDSLDADAADASDDPVYAGGMSEIDLGDTSADAASASLEDQLTLTGLDDDGAAMALDEGSSVVDDAPLRGFEDDGDPDLLGADIPVVDGETVAEDLDDLEDVQDDTHDPDDPDDPDGYGVPPGTDEGDVPLASSP